MIAGLLPDETNSLLLRLGAAMSTAYGIHQYQQQKPAYPAFETSDTLGTMSAMLDVRQNLLMNANGAINRLRGLLDHFEPEKPEVRQALATLHDFATKTGQLVR